MRSAYTTILEYSLFRPLPNCLEAYSQDSHFFTRHVAAAPPPVSLSFHYVSGQIWHDKQAKCNKSTTSASILVTLGKIHKRSQAWSSQVKGMALLFLILLSQYFFRFSPTD